MDARGAMMWLMSDIQAAIFVGLVALLLSLALAAG
jgi:hypothetical protein